MDWQFFLFLEPLFLCFLVNCVAAEPGASQEGEGGGILKQVSTRHCLQELC